MENLHSSFYPNFDILKWKKERHEDEVSLTILIVARLNTLDNIKWITNVIQSTLYVHLSDLKPSIQIRSWKFLNLKGSWSKLEGYK